MKNKSAFTVVELVIVIAVIGILAAILIPTFTSLINGANNANAEVALTTAYKEYVIDATDGYIGDPLTGTEAYSIYAEDEVVAVFEDDTYQYRNKEGWGPNSFYKDYYIGEYGDVKLYSASTMATISEPKSIVARAQRSYSLDIDEISGKYSSVGGNSFLREVDLSAAGSKSVVYKFAGVLFEFTADGNDIVEVSSHGEYITHYGDVYIYEKYSLSGLHHESMQTEFNNMVAQHPNVFNGDNRLAYVADSTTFYLANQLNEWYSYEHLAENSKQYNIYLLNPSSLELVHNYGTYQLYKKPVFIQEEETNIIETSLATLRGEEDYTFADRIESEIPLMDYHRYAKFDNYLDNNFVELFVDNEVLGRVAIYFNKTIDGWMWDESISLPNSSSPTWYSASYFAVYSTFNFGTESFVDTHLITIYNTYVANCVLEGITPLKRQEIYIFEESSLVSFPRSLYYWLFDLGWIEDAFSKIDTSIRNLHVEVIEERKMLGYRPYIISYWIIPISAL